MPAPSKYPTEVRDRAVRMVNEKLTCEPALAVSAACRLVGEQIGINKNTLRNWVKQNRLFGHPVGVRFAGCWLAGRGRGPRGSEALTT